MTEPLAPSKRAVSVRDVLVGLFTLVFWAGVAVLWCVFVVFAVGWMLDRL